MKKKTQTLPLPSDAAAAFADTHDEIVAVRDDELLPVNLDPERACSIALATAAHVRPLLPVLKKLPDYDPTAAVELRRYALAALHAHLIAGDPPKDDGTFAPLLEEGTQLRVQMLSVAEMLVVFGYVSPERVAEIRAGSGHADLASDLIALRALLGDQWERVVGKVPITRAQIERAGVVGTDLHERVAARKFVGPPSTEEDSRKTRARAFTLLVRKYDECRRGVAFLRWRYGDVDRFAPSIYIKGPRRSSTVIDDEPAQTETPTTTPPEGVPPTPAPTSVVP